MPTERLAMKHQVRYLNPSVLPPAPGYTQVVTAAGGTFVFVSGQVPLNAEGVLVGKGDLRRQSEQVFENIRSALREAGATMSQIVKISYFVVNLQPADALLLRKVRLRFLEAHNPPASTMVGVVSLFDRDWLIEVEAIARIP